MAAENILEKPKSEITPSSHHNAAHLHASINDLQSANFLTVSEIGPGQDFKVQDHYSKVKGQIKVKI